MADNNFTINLNGDGEVKISEEVVCIIAGLGATEVEGIDSLTGGLNSENMFKAGMSKLSKAIRITGVESGNVTVRMSIVMKMGFEIPKVCKNVQDKVKQAIETMTGLKVDAVDVKVATVSVQ